MLKHLLLAMAFASPAFAREIPVANTAAFDTAGKTVRAGDTIILKNGIWADARLKIYAQGTAEKPVTIRAQTPGKVVFTGDSRIALAGAHIVVDGLWFQNPTGEEAIELRSRPDELANDCRITNCAVTNDLPAAAGKSARFVSIHGARNRVDHCFLQGKTSAGSTMVVWLSNDTANQGRHRIDHNHFGSRRPLGRNGGETIRIGDSNTSMQTAACIVEHNLFEHCDGEIECISNKSCANLYRNNTFRAVSGTLTLRHGNGCRVENNVFLGEGAKGTGGVRIIGEDHVVMGNYFENLTGNEARSAICLMLGIPNSVANGYFQVKRARVTDNTFVNCEHNIFIGLSFGNASLPPVETEISGNRIQTNKREAFEILCSVDGVAMKNNVTADQIPNTSKRPSPEPSGPSWRK